MVQMLGKNDLAVPQKTKHRVMICSSNSISGYILKRTESRDSNKYLYMFIEALFRIVKGWKQPVMGLILPPKLIYGSPNPQDLRM